MRILLNFVLAILFSAMVVAQENDWLIVPGKRIGPIDPDTSRADLDRIFGKENVRDQDIDDGEGGPLHATLVFPNETAASLAILWQYRRNRIAEVDICHSWYPRDPYLFPTCKWHTVDGVSLRTSLEKLEALNGRAFQLNQWGTDAGPGGIRSWLGGRLSVYERNEKKGGLGLALGVQVTRNGLTEQQSKLYDSIQPEKGTPDRGVMLSSDRAVRGLHPIVYFMVLHFPVSEQGPGR